MRTLKILAAIATMLVPVTLLSACGADPTGTSDDIAPESELPGIPEDLFIQPPQDRGVNYAGPHYADDFILGKSATIQEFRWWGADASSSTAAIRLFADDGSGAPRRRPFFEVRTPVVLASPASTVIPRTATLPVFENRATLTNAPVLQAGVRYYVSISGPSFWLSSSAPGSEWWWRLAESDAWMNAAADNPNNLSFQLVGVPAP